MSFKRSSSPLQRAWVAVVSNCSGADLRGEGVHKPEKCEADLLGWGWEMVHLGKRTNHASLVSHVPSPGPTFKNNKKARGGSTHLSVILALPLQNGRLKYGAARTSRETLSQEGGGNQPLVGVPHECHPHSHRNN